MSDTEASADIDKTVQKLERLLRRQNEYFDLQISGFFASMDKAPVQAAKAVKLEPFSGYESQDIERWLQKFANRIEAGGRQLDSSTMAADLASHLSGLAETYYFSLEPHMRRDFDALTNALKNRFSSDDFKWRLRQSLSSRKQGPKESLDSYIEFINSTCQRLGVSKADQLHFFVDGLRDEIKREVLMHKPEDYQTTENVARLKVSVDRTIAENRQDPEKDKEKEILYKLLDKLTPHPPTAGSGVERDVSAFNIADGSVNDLSGEFQKLRAELRQEFRDEMKSLRENLFPQVASIDKVPSRQFETNTYARPTCYRCGVMGHLAVHCRHKLSSNQATAHSPNFRPLVCFSCNEIGHKARDCTYFCEVGSSDEQSSPLLTNHLN